MARPPIRARGGAGISARLATRGSEIGGNLRLEDRAGVAAGRVLENGEIELLRLVRLPARLEETRERQARVAPERAVDGGGLLVGFTGAGGVAGCLARVRQPDERFLLAIVGRRRRG